MKQFRINPVPWSFHHSTGYSRKAPSGLARWLIIIGFAGVLGALAGIYAVAGAYVAKHPNASDFFKFYLSSVRVRYGQSPYWQAPELGERDRLCGRPTPLKPLGDPPTDPEPGLAAVQSCVHPNLNPPVFSAVTRPLGYVHPTVAWWLWSALSLACFGQTLRVVWKSGIFHLKVWYAPALWVAGSFAFLPSIINFTIGQLGFVIFLPVTLCWLALRRGKDTTGGAWLGLAAALKPFLGLLLFVLALEKKWRACLACLIILLLTFVLGGQALGFGAYQEYFNTLSHIYWYSGSGNASLQGVFSRIFGGSESIPWIAWPLLGRWLTIACSVLLLASLIGLNRHIRKVAGNQEERMDAVFAITLPAMLLMSPLAWVYYLPLLLLSAGLLWHISWRIPARKTLAWLILAALIMNNIPPGTVPTGESVSYRMGLWEGSRVFHGLLVFYLVAFTVIAKAYRYRLLGFHIQVGLRRQRSGKSFEQLDSSD